MSEVRHSRAALAGPPLGVPVDVLKNEALRHSYAQMFGSEHFIETPMVRLHSVGPSKCRRDV